MSTEAVRTEVRAARREDYEQVVRLLQVDDLPTAGLSPALPDFVVAEEGGRIVGAVGLEIYDDVALLRSAVVAREHRGTGVGGRLVVRLLELATSRGVREVYLLTTTAERYFPRFGFVAIPRDAVAGPVHASEEFKGACPDSASAMRLVLQRSS